MALAQNGFGAPAQTIFCLQPFSTPGWHFQQQSSKGRTTHLFDATIGILAFLPKSAHSLLLGSTHDHFGGNPITLEDKGECLLSITLFLHWLHLQPTKTGGIHLSVEVKPTRLCLDLHCVPSEHVMTKTPVSKLPFICPELMSRRRVGYCPHPPVGSSIKCVLLCHICQN